MDNFTSNGIFMNYSQVQSLYGDSNQYNLAPRKVFCNGLKFGDINATQTTGCLMLIDT